MKYLKIEQMATIFRPFYDWAPSAPINWKSPSGSMPIVPLPAWWGKQDLPPLAQQATYRPNKDIANAVRKAYDAQIAEHSKVVAENYGALRAGFVSNWVTRNRQNYI